MRNRIPSRSRRALLAGLGGVATLVALPGAAETCAPDAASHAQPFFGSHQAGVTTPRPPHGLVVAFNVLATTLQDLERLFRTLTERIAFLMRGGTPPVLDPRFPPSDSGVLGPVIVPDDLTVTVAVGASLFDGRFGLGARRPLHLEPMGGFPNDALDPSQCHGDLVLQICASTAEANIHALRDVVRNLPDLLMLRWKQDGFLPPARPGKTDRNLLGFKDGTANLDTADRSAMDGLVWVRADAGEPAWAVGGSYQVVRIIRQFVERWDRTPLREQQLIFGRDKASGAPLGATGEHDLPDYSGDPEGKTIPLDAHIRLANPRSTATASSRILRRPYNYARGVTKAGQLDMGLLFICYQSNLRDGFIAVQNRLNGEPLEEYVKPVGGGYFFVLPGVVSDDDWLGRALLLSAWPESRTSRPDS